MPPASSAREDPASHRYLSDDCLKRNPSWDQEDSPWHVCDPFAFLDRMQPKAAHRILHFLLDLSAVAFSAPQRTWRTRLASRARRLEDALSKDAGVRLLGGETLMVLARTAKVPTAR